MNELTKVFNYGSEEVRAVIRDGEPWFVAKDVCMILEHSDTSMAVKRLDEDEKLTQTMFVSGQNRKTWLVNEPGLYSLILTSRKPEARAFKRWVTHEVLPSIRKTGGYQADVPRTFAEALRLAADQQEEIERNRPKVEQYNRFISGENYQTLEQVGKALGVGRNKLSRFLRTIEIFTKREGSPVPYQRFINEGYFVVKETPSPYYGHNNVQTFITAKGVSFIDRKLQDYGGAERINAMKMSEIETGLSRRHLTIV